MSEPPHNDSVIPLDPQRRRGGFSHWLGNISGHEAPQPRYEVRASASDSFSWLRTRLSVERTLMSWVRTATALIGFGFTIVQFFERIAGMEGVKDAVTPLAPRYLGLALIVAGILALTISVWQYRMTIHYLWSDTFKEIRGLGDEPKTTPLLAVSIVLILIGLFAFVSVFTRFF